MENLEPNGDLVMQTTRLLVGVVENVRIRHGVLSLVSDDIPNGVIPRQIAGPRVALQIIIFFFWSANTSPAPPVISGVPFISIEGESVTVGPSGRISNLMEKTVDKITDNDIKFPIAMSRTASEEIGEVSAPSVHIQYTYWLAAEQQKSQSVAYNNSRTYIRKVVPCLNVISIAQLVLLVKQDCGHLRTNPIKFAGLGIKHPKILADTQLERANCLDVILNYILVNSISNVSIFLTCTSSVWSARSAPRHQDWLSIYNDTLETFFYRTPSEFIFPRRQVLGLFFIFVSVLRVNKR